MIISADVKNAESGHYSQMGKKRRAGSLQLNGQRKSEPTHINMKKAKVSSSLFSAGRGAICDAPNAGRGAIVDAPKSGRGAIFDASKIRSGAIFDAPKIRKGAISDANHLDVMSKFKSNQEIFSLSSLIVILIHRVMHDQILF